LKLLADPDPEGATVRFTPMFRKPIRMKIR
jgi:hypothetical protein